MLDVHPPNDPTHTWTDFFIHIATIVVGLLIAIGLEQTVEHIHQHYELSEPREALRREFESNRAKVADDERNWLETTARLKNNLLVLEYLRSHPATKQADLPGVLVWLQYPFLYDHAVWDAAQKNGITHLMPLDESNRYQELYEGDLAALNNQTLETWNAINDARRFDLLDIDPTHLSPAQLDETIQLTETALARHIEVGYSYGRLAHEYPEMPQSITWQNIEHIRPDQIDAAPQGLAAAAQRTEDRVKAAVAAQ